MYVRVSLADDKSQNKINSYDLVSQHVAQVIVLRYFLDRLLSADQPDVVIDVAC